MEAIPLTWDVSASVLVAALCLHSLVVIFPRQSAMRGPLLTYTLLSEIVGGCAGGKPPTGWVSPDNLPAGTYKAVEKNGTICPELPGLTDFEMVVTDGEEGQLANLTAIAAGERLTTENAIPVKWYSWDTVYNLSRFGSETIEGTPKCFHVEPSIDVAPFVEGLYRIFQQNQEQKTDLWFGSQLIFCYTNLGLMVGIGAEKTGTRWHATRYAFRIHFPGLPTYDYICKASPSITSRRFINQRDLLRRHLRAQGKAPKRSHHEVVLELSPKPIQSANPDGENPRLALNFVKSDSLPAGTYKAVEKNGTICPELPGLTDFEMVVTDGEEGQLVNLTAIAAGERLTMENAIPVKWYSYSSVYNLSRFGSETIEGTPKCFHVEPSIFVALFVEGLYRTLRQNQKQKTGLWFGSQLIFCYTNLGLMVGIGAEKMGSCWHATRYAFRIHFPGLPTYDYICKASPSITSRRFISNRDSLRRHLRAQGKAPKRSHREVVLEPSSEPILSANPNGENPRLALDFVKSDSLPAGTYKAVEKNGTICPELPGLTDFEMVVTDGEEGQLVNLTAIAEGERLTMENATPVKWYAYQTVYSLSRFGSETIEGTPKCFHVEPSIFVALFVEGLYRTLRQNQKQKTGLWFGSQLIFCYTNLGLMVGIGAEKMGRRWHATRYAFRIHFPGLPTYDYICKASPSITSHKKTKQKREYVQQELLPHRESREWYSHESIFEPQPKIGRLELAKISAAAASEEGTDGLHDKRTSTVPLVDHSYAMELDEVSPEARNPPPARVFEDDLGKRLSPVGDNIPARATSGFEHTKRTLNTSGGRGRQTSRKNRNPQHLLPLADMGKYLAIAAPNAEQMSKHE